MKEYKNYREKIITTLSKEARKNGKEIVYGCWKGETQDAYTHILPLNGGKNTKEARRDAIQKYLGIKIDDKFLSKNGALHQYAHHLNSSQLLCYMALRPLLIDDSKTKYYRPTEALKMLLASQNINISECAQCEFEYNDHLMWKERNIPEGTSFDFHIKDNNHEYFFEIKFTEDGFGKAEKDDEHIQKFNELYLNKIEKVINKVISVEECVKYYQLFRNIIRGDSDSKTIVFITDKNNPATEEEIKIFSKEYLTDTTVRYLFLKWQDMYKELPLDFHPFQFICFNPDFKL